jgi:hypothetical protein
MRPCATLSRELLRMAAMTLYLKKEARHTRTAAQTNVCFKWGAATSTQRGDETTARSVLLQDQCCQRAKDGHRHGFAHGLPQKDFVSIGCIRVRIRCA